MITESMQIRYWSSQWGEAMAECRSLVHCSAMCGLTLVELLVTLALTGLVLGLAAPSFTLMVGNAKRSSAVTEVVASVLFARSEAVRRGEPVTLCASSSGSTCSSATDPAWEEGWMVFVDPDANKVPASSEDVLRVHRPENPSYGLDGSDSIARGITFALDGVPSAQGSLTLCDAQETKILQITAVGHVVVESTGSGCGP